MPPAGAYTDVDAHTIIPTAQAARFGRTAMTEQENKKPAKPHSIQLAEHRLLTVTGVKSVPTFTDKLIEIELEGESLTVTGHDLVVKGLDLDGGRLAASGYVTSMRYSTAPAPSSVIKRIFK